MQMVIGEERSFCMDKDKKQKKERRNSYASYVTEERLLLPEEADEVCREPVPAYADNLKQQGEFTIEDYYALPDEYRCELIDGIFYDMAAPSNIHQLFSNKISRLLGNYIDSKKGKCEVLSAPVDVRLNKDEKTNVQPDILVVCDRDKIYENYIWGAPDLVIEILSKSTGRKDRTVKLRKYREAGVREYWMVDPDMKTVIVYWFEGAERQFIYGFEDNAPVGIFQGGCSITFSELYEEIEYLYGRKAE